MAFIPEKTSTWNTSLGDLKDRETLRMVEHVALGVRAGMVLHVKNMFIQELVFLACVAASLEAITSTVLADGRGDLNVTLSPLGARFHP